jgi:hypothetical protein
LFHMETQGPRSSENTVLPSTKGLGYGSSGRHLSSKSKALSSFPNTKKSTIWFINFWENYIKRRGRKNQATLLS